MFSIYELADEENHLIMEASNNYGQFFNLAKDTVDYSWKFVGPIQDNAYVFNAFLTQASKSLSLALLSIVRHHLTQTYQLLRNAIESISLACYSLHKPEENNYVRFDPDSEKLLDKPKVKVKAYKWLNESYPKHSKHLEKIKSEFINKMFAHSNLIDAVTSVKYSDSNTHNSVFDDIKPLTLKMMLVSLSNLTIMMVELVGEVLKDYPLAKLKVGFDEQIQHFRAINMSQFKTINADPSYPRHGKY
ncbi:hypothetical protein [Paenibacillus sp. FSL H3-0457]|uniref:hypothetical protein n=1 Tax=Paenibacillus sp. FSL H3-0457 TaxID=2921430 RepID=UPI0030EC003D